ncbi:MAG: class I SAM-dependent methyltransferase [Candidatus Bathyarchaeota archaeon]|nr:class I SAM-dependent methyltransferase [Candidatus Bathyarchaeota archaeon]
MTDQLLHGELAKYYDKIYSFKDYLDEAIRLQNLIMKHLESGGNALLDVACGTGLHLKHLKDDFICMGVDASKAMLKIARKNAPGVTFKEADMAKLQLGKQFDVITCLLSSVGYVKTYANLKRTIQNFSSHLKKGGVALIEPSHAEAFYVAGEPRISVYDGKDAKIARVNVAKAKQSTAVLNMHILVAEKGKDAQYFVDTHELGLFDVDRTLDIMKEAGLKAKYLKAGLMAGRELFVGVKK